MSADVPCFGIDFGTTNSSMAWCDPKSGDAKIILNAEGDPKTPSLVFFGEEVLVGKPADDRMQEVENTNDPEERALVTGRLIKSIKRNLVDPPVIPIQGSEPVRPVEVVTHILRKLKRDAEDGHFHKGIERVVITCPAVFDQKEREVILEAAAMAGFRRVEVVEEPTAAALAFTRLAQKVGNGVLVYDLGAGTFDLSVVVRDEDGSFFLPVEPQGDPRCGGDDLDLALYRYCDELARTQLSRSISLTEDVDLVFLRQCRSRKENLSSSMKSKFSSLLSSSNGLTQFRHEIDRETFESLIRDRIEGTVNKTVKLWEQVKDRVDTLVLIGGSSSVPLVKQLLKERLSAIEVRSFAEKDYAVALGAAYHAYGIWVPTARSVGDEEEIKEAKEYARALKSCWNDRWLTRTEVEWLASLAKRELKLDHQVIESVERRVLNDTIENVLKRQEPLAQGQYGKVLKLGWKDKRLDALRSISPARLNMLLDDHDRFRDFDFADSPVKAADRKEMLAGLPWAVFVMVARVAIDTTLSAAAVLDRLDAVADDLGLSKKQAAAVEREILGSTLDQYFKQRERASSDEYRRVVKRACEDGWLNEEQSDGLETERKRLGLDSAGAAAIERSLVGNTVALILTEQEELRRLARKHKVDVSLVSGSGKLGRVTVSDMERYLEEQDRAQRQRKEKERWRMSLFKLKGSLDEHGNQFVSDCESEARKIMDSETDWQSHLGNCVDKALTAFAKRVQTETEAEVNKLTLGLTVPTFLAPQLTADLKVSMNHNQTVARAGRWGGGAIGAAIGTAIVPVIGTVIGAFIGSAIGEGLAESETQTADKNGTLANVQEAARGLCPALKDKAYKYLGNLDKKIDAKWSKPSR